MKTILISIRREHNVKIFDTKDKLWEGRKTLPCIVSVRNDLDPTHTYHPSDTDVRFIVYEPKTGGGCGMVVGEFVCDFAQSFNRTTADFTAIGRALCTTENFARHYFNRPRGFMIRVRNARRYTHSKSLSECFLHPLKPPQSWCYVEVKE